MIFQDRNRLAKLLLSMSSNDEGMLLSEFDGFCAGLAICPDDILPEEWMQVIVHGAATHGATHTERKTTETLIRAHCAAVALALASPEIGYDPIFEQDSITGETLWEPWVCGFHRAMQLRPGAWEEVLETGHADVVAAITTLEALLQLAIGQSVLPERMTSTLSDEAPRTIPELVRILVSATGACHVS